MSLTAEADHVVLTLADDGIGFDAVTVLATPPAGHLGLRSLVDLAEQRGADLQVASAPERALDGADPAAHRRGGDVITVVIVDDHQLVRAGLRSLLDAVEDVRVVGEAADGEQAVEVVQREDPTSTLMDLSMPRVDGVEAARRLKRRGCAKPASSC